MLVFPGPAPVRFDTPYLRLDPAQDRVGFRAPVTTELEVQVSPRGRRAVLTALTAALRRCLHGSGEPRCPQPSARSVPGSLTGRIVTPLAQSTRVSVGSAARGVLRVQGTASVTGTYTGLTFDNQQTKHSGTVSVPIAATAVAVPPARIAWTAPT